MTTPLVVVLAQWRVVGDPPPMIKEILWQEMARRYFTMANIQAASEAP